MIITQEHYLIFHLLGNENFLIHFKQGKGDSNLKYIR